jgi:hypothetical protein
MDEQVLAMMRDRFDSLDETLKTMNASLTTHVEKDERYWLKIDQQQAQISLIRWLCGGGAGAALVAWIVEKKFGGH